MRKLYTSTYRDMSEYLQDFGFGGFVGYGKRETCAWMFG
jgi:hypothetical protein